MSGNSTLGNISPLEYESSQRAVRYRIADLDQYIESRMLKSTCYNAV